MKVIVIIPCYNESESILNVVRELKEVKPDFDYVVINDCSTDNTEEILVQNGIHHINLPVNLGIGGGVQTGFKYAVENGYDISVQLDGDGQHDPRYLDDIVTPVAEGRCDMCVGSRFINKQGFQSSFMRRVGIRFLSRLIKICSGVEVFDTTSGFRAMNAAVTKYFTRSYAQDYPEPEAIISAATQGFRISEAAVVMRERQGGKSSINPLKSAYYMIKVSVAIILYSFSGRVKR